MKVGSVVGLLGSYTGSIVVAHGFSCSTLQFSSVTQSYPTLCDLMDCSTPGLPVHHQLPEFGQLMSIDSVMPSSHVILCYALLLLPSIFSTIRVFSNESPFCIRWPKYWSFSLNISPSNEHSGLISFRMDWLDLLALQGTLKSLLQYHSSKTSILWHSAFFIIQLSYQYMTTAKIIGLTRWIFVGKVMSLLFNMLSMLVIAFWLQSPSVVILESPKIKSLTVSIKEIPIYLPGSDGTRCHDLSFLNVEL